jgi:hypothetical protein
LLERAVPPADLADLARHRLESGDVERAAPLLDQAAREAAAIGAIAEAEGFARMAAELRRGVAGS